MPSVSFLATLVSGLALLPSVLAGFDPNSAKNIAVYWGQNSINIGSGPNAQDRLSKYCGNSKINIIPVAFLNSITNPTTINLANVGNNCTTFPDAPQLLDCPQVEDDIKSCQGLGKTIILSIGGATYSQGGFQSDAAARTAANLVWNMFGPVKAGSATNRPFGTAVVDGFDFDFESTVSRMAPFALELRRLMDLDRSKRYYLSAAPQCPYPDLADREMLEGGVPFDFLLVQYYNNYCGVSNFVEGQAVQNNFNFADWDRWAKTVSKNPKVKVLLGIPANAGAGAGYTRGSKLKAAIQFTKQYSSFGGVMMWDMSQLWANSGFLDEVAADLN